MNGDGVRGADLRVEIRDNGHEPARCKVWRGGALIFSGRSDLADRPRSPDTDTHEDAP